MSYDTHHNCPPVQSSISISRAWKWKQGNRKKNETIFVCNEQSITNLLPINKINNWYNRDEQKKFMPYINWEWIHKNKENKKKISQTKISVSTPYAIHSCLNKTYYLPGRRPLECEVNKEKRDSYNVKCCSTDFCNNDKTLTLEINHPGGIHFCCAHLFPFIFFSFCLIYDQFH